MRRRPVCILCMLLVVFLCVTDWLGYSLIRGNPLPESVQTWIKKHPESTICGEVVRCQENEDFQSVYLKDTYLIYNSEKISIDNVRVYLKQKKYSNSGESGKDKLLSGSLILVSGKLEEVQDPGNPGEFDSRQYYACRRIYYVMKKGKIEKQSQNHSVYGQFLIDMQQKFAEILEKACGNEAGAFEAIVLGDKSNLDAELKMRYQMAGIIHILAISGLHISLLGMGLYNILKKIGLGIWPAGLLALVIMLQYGMMTGGTVSTMRAVCMFLLSVGAKIAGRIYDMPTGMAASAILILVENPAYLLDGGFLLSFGSVIGIGCVWPLITEVMDREKSEWKTENKGKEEFLKSTGKSLWKSLLASGTVQLTTLPVVLWFYGEVSVLGILLNLLVLPTVGIVLGSGTAGALVGLFSGRGAFLAALPGRIILKGYEILAALAGKLPFCTWVGGKPQIWQIVGYYVVLAAGMWIYRRAAWSYVDNDSSLKRGSDRYNRKVSGKKIQILQNLGIHKSQNRHKDVVMKIWGIRSVCAAAVCLGVLLIGYKPREDFRIACLDVGQGDGIVIEIEKQWNILIDGGSTNKSALGQYQLIPYLKSRGISRLDGIYISHTDEDHISGVRQLFEYIGKGLTVLRVENLILPEWKNIQDNKNYQELIQLAETAGTRVLTAKAGDKIGYGQTILEVLWPPEGADGTEVNEDAMVLEMTNGDFKGIFTGDIGKETEEKLLQNGTLEDVVFLKVAHHGSKYSTGEEFLETVKPELAVISCSATNTYGHPSPDTLQRLKETGAEIKITKDDGAVMLRNVKGKYKLSTYR